MITKRSIIEDYKILLNLKKVAFHTGSSFILQCTFYKTKHPDIYLTNYDFGKDKNIEEDGVLTIFYRNKGIFKKAIISTDVIKDKKLFNEILDQFKHCYT